MKKNNLVLLKEGIKQDTKLKNGSKNNWWFVCKENTLSGPFSTKEIIEKITYKKIFSNDFCFRHGFNEWRPVFSIKEFDEIILPSVFSIHKYPKIDIPFRKSINKKPEPVPPVSTLNNKNEHIIIKNSKNTKKSKYSIKFLLTALILTSCLSVAVTLLITSKNII